MMLSLQSSDRRRTKRDSGTLTRQTDSINPVNGVPLIKIGCADGELLLYASPFSQIYDEHLLNDTPTVINSCDTIAQNILNILKNYPTAVDMGIIESITVNDDPQDDAMKILAGQAKLVDDFGNCFAVNVALELENPVNADDTVMDTEPLLQTLLFNCIYCSSCFASKEEFDLHIFSHEHMFKCTVCEMSFVDSDALKKHIDMHDNAIINSPGVESSEYTPGHFETQGTFVTDKENIFSEITDIVNSRDVKQGNLSINIENYGLIESDDGKVIPEERSISDSLEQHLVNLKHNEIIDVLFDEVHDDSNSTSILPAESFSKDITSESNALIPKEGIMLPYSCPYDGCDMTWIIFEDLTTHMHKDHSDAPAVCPFCNKEFRYKQNLKRHILTHSENKPFACRYCNKAFRQKASLKAHMLCHFTEPNMAAAAVETVKDRQTVYKCEEDKCLKVFTSSSKLKEHLSSHSTVIPYKCGHCEEFFVYHKDIKAHVMKVHRTASAAKDMESDVNVTENDEQTGTDENGGKDDSWLTCPNHCGKYCKTLKELTSHVKLNKCSSLKYKCGICGQKFTLMQSLRRHKVLHLHAKEFPCSLCLKSYGNQKDLNKHMLMHNKKYFECDKCDSTFQRKQSLKVHMMSHYIVKSDSVKSSQENQISCCMNLCTEVFNSQYDLRKHMRQRHPCEVCGKSFNNQYTLRRHWLSHEDDRPFKCSICDKRYRHRATYEDHMKQHVDRVPTCKICDRTFARPSGLDKHLKKHHEQPESLACSYCCKTFSTKARLSAHNLSHSKPHNCSHCTKSFATKQLLDVHILKVSGIKSFTCHECPKSFVTKFDLKTHMVVHSSDRNHQCMYCGAQFARVSQVNRHMLSHMGERNEKCDVCGKGFLCRDALSAHMAVHSDSRPFTCPICQKSFKKKAHMLRHEMIHSKQPTPMLKDCDLLETINHHNISIMQPNNPMSMQSTDISQQSNAIVVQGQYLILNTGKVANIADDNMVSLVTRNDVDIAPPSTAHHILYLDDASMPDASYDILPNTTDNGYIYLNTLN